MADDKRLALVIALVLAAVTLGIYWPVRHNEFVLFDDQDYVTTNPVVLQGLTAKGVIWAFTATHASNWHPLTWLSHMSDCQLFGAHAGAHHLTNVVLHSLNTLVLFLFLRRLTSATWRSALVAALFSLHPLRVESVAWVAERKDVLSAFFGLLTLWTYAIYANKRGDPQLKPEVAAPNRTPRLAYALSLLCFALGLMSKPMLVTLPFVLLLLDYWPLARIRIELERRALAELGKRIIEKVPFFILSAASCVITLLVQREAIWDYERFTLSLRLGNAVVAYVRYLGETLWPTDLAVLYPHPTLWPAWQIAGAALVVALLTMGVIAQRQRRPWLPVGWFWFVGMLVPVIGVVQVGAQSMADRYTYLPLIGVFVALVWLGDDVFRQFRRPIFARVSLSVVLLLACALRTRQQIHVWQDTEHLFAHAAAVTQNNWVAHYQLASLALDRYQQRQTPVASATAPSAPAARDDLAQSIQHCEATIRARPDYGKPHITLAKALTECGRVHEAEAHLQTALRLGPDSAEARENLAAILAGRGHGSEAVVQYQTALKIRPDWAPVLNNLAWLLATHRDPQIRYGSEAVRLAERACQLSGGTNLSFLQTLAAAHAEAGHFTNAVRVCEQAAQLARTMGLQEAEARANARLELYRSAKPYRE